MQTLKMFGQNYFLSQFGMPSCDSQSSSRISNPSSHPIMVSHYTFFFFKCQMKRGYVDVYLRGKWGRIRCIYFQYFIWPLNRSVISDSILLGGRGMEITPVCRFCCYAITTHPSHSKKNKNVLKIIHLNSSCL